MITANRSQIQKVLAKVEPLKIWLRPMGKTCKIRLHRLEDAVWVRAELVGHDLECSKALPVAGTEQGVLIVKLNGQIDHSKLEEIVKNFDAVTLMHDPA